MKPSALAHKKGKIGSSFDDFLAEQGILRECEEKAIKRILADQKPAAAHSTACSIRRTRA